MLGSATRAYPSIDSQFHPLGHMTGNPLVLGILGGIASGKSTVARMLESLGAVVVDADRLAHEALRDPKIHPELTALFGPGTVSREGEVDRAVIAASVFDDPELLAALEDLVHPVVRRRILQAIADNGHAEMVVVDAPLLVEAGLTDLVDAMLFVEAPRRVRSRRAAEHRSWSGAELERRELRQMPVGKKRRQAGYVVENDGSIEDLRARVALIYRKILEDK